MGVRREGASGYEQHTVRPLLGGLDTKTPPQLLGAGRGSGSGFSPDLVNVAFDRRGASARGGFASYTKQAMRLSCMRGVPFRGTGRQQFVNNSPDVDYLVAPGAMYAGHRPIYDDLDIRSEITLEFWFSPSDLIAVHGGNASPSGLPTGGTAPYDLLVRPILSKGPIKRNAMSASVLGAPHATGQITWTTTQRWGHLGTGQHAMPFCVYLFQVAGVWQFRFSAHFLSGGLWNLVTVTNACSTLGGVREGSVYHVIASYSTVAQEMHLTVGIFDVDAMRYESAVAFMPGGSTPIPAGTPTPVQVFDCPQEFIDAPAAPSAGRPPGLELPDEYWFNSTRATGRIEDIVIYRGSRSDLEITGAPRRRDTTGLPVVSHWPGDSTGDAGIFDEVSGLGNHLAAMPGFPTKAKSGWQFNGLTSYALIELSNENPVGASGGNPNWRWATPSTASPQVNGAFQDLVRNNRPYGLEVAFWVDTIEPNFEQVLMEAHGVIRLAIGVDGRIRGYVLDAAASPVGPSYQNAVVGVTTLVPGNRYNVILFRESSTVLSVYVNGSREGQIAVGASSATSWPVGGLTIGMGSYQFLTRTDLANGDPDNHTLIADIVATDHRSGFMGTIEYARVLAGSPYNPNTVSWYDKQYERQLRDAAEKGKLWVIPGTASNRWEIAYGGVGTSVATTANIGPGHISVLTIDRPFGKQLGYVVAGTTSSPTYYLMNMFVRGIADGGHLQVVSAHVEFVRTLGSWDFTSEFEDQPYSASHDMAFEWFSTGGIFYVPQSWRATAGLRTDVVDATGFLGPAQKRSVEPDMLGQAYLEMAASAWNRLGKPFLTRGPRECRPQVSYGMLLPKMGENAIAGIAHFESQVSGEHAIIIAGRRNVCLSGPRWERGSPFPSQAEEDWALSFRGGTDRVRRDRLPDIDVGSTWAAAFAEIDLWVRPNRLDGKRLLACSGDVNLATGAASMRYLIYIDDGVLYVIGAESGSNAWVFMQGAVGVSPTLRSRCSLVLGEWNHIVVRIASSTVLARINGHLEPMASLFGFQGSAINTGTIQAPSPARLWIGGFDETRRPLKIPTLGGVSTITLTLDAFDGNVCWVRERSTADPRWTANQDDPVSITPPASDVNTRFLYALNDRDAGWTAIDSSASAGHGRIELNECSPIKDDMVDVGTKPIPYSTALVRDQLILTNGSDFPHSVLFTSRADKLGWFRCYRLGMERPGVTSTGLGFGGGTIGTFEDGRTYSVWMTYANALNQESEPTFLGAIQVSGGGKDELRVAHIPRSPDPQVVSRRFYVQTDGSSALFAEELLDNESRDVAIRQINNLPALVLARRLPAPKAKLVEAGPGTVYLANLKGNGHAFAFSGDGQISYFPEVNFVAEDSRGGAPFAGMRRQLGAVYMLKRDGSSRVTNRGGVVQVDDVDESQAPAGGAVNVDNAIMGLCPRGVVTLDGANTHYSSDRLEALIRGDVFRQQLGREEELLRTQGVYSLVDSTILFSVRGSDSEKRTILALHIDQVAGAAAWSIWRVPPHVAMSRVVDPGGRTIEVLLGTVDGTVLVYNRDVAADGAWAGVNEFGVTTLSAPITGPFSAASYTHASVNVFDTHGDGMRGAIVLVTDGNGDVVAEARVTRNTHQVLTLDRTVTVGAGVHTLWVGGIESRWSSPWLEWQRPGGGLLVDAIDLDIEASPTALRLETVTSTRSVPGRLFPAGVVGTEREIRFVPLSDGAIDQPIPVQLVNRGRYFRFRFGAAGTLLPWSVMGYSLRFTETGHRGVPN